MKKTTNQNQLIVLLAGIVFLGIFSGCKEEVPPQPPAPEVTVAQPLQKNVRRYYDLTGNTEAVEMVDEQRGTCTQAKQLARKQYLEPKFILSQYCFIVCMQKAD